MAAILLLLVCTPAWSATVSSEALTDPEFLNTWQREDQPVAAGTANRTWLWGPEPFTGELSEPYASSPGGTRSVQYFDKARMEINDPDAERGRWYVTTGLLATELMTGQMQTADGLVEQRGPAQIPVAGDADDPDGPTYASFDRVRNLQPFNTGTTLVSTIDRTGQIDYDHHFARYNVLAERFVPETGHTVASVFWEYLNTTGTVIENGEAVTGRLFEPWFYATGLPVTEAYWSSVKVGGERRDVLIQVFERRVLTYTPSNELAWRVELGNVGRHYYWWRYERDAAMPEATGQTLWRPDLTRIPGRASGDGWQMDADAGQRSLTLSFVPGAWQGSGGLVARYWHQSGSMPDDAFRVVVDVQVSGGAEAGIGLDLVLDGEALGSMIYFGVSESGVRFVTHEAVLGGRSAHLVRPAGNIPGWSREDGSWNELSVSVSDGRAWFAVNAVVVAEVELPDEEVHRGVALAGGSTGPENGPSQVTFRNLAIESTRE